MGEKIQVSKRRMDGQIYRREFDLDTDRTTLPVNWTYCVNINTLEKINTDWLRLFDGRVVCYTDRPHIQLRHVHTVPDRRALDIPSHLRFIVDHYAALPDYTVFSHFPFDHNEDFIEDLREAIASPPKTFQNLVKWKPQMTADGCLIHHIEKEETVTTRFLYIEKYRRPVRSLWASLFSTPIPDVINPSISNMFVVSKEALLSRSRDFWVNVHRLAILSGFEHLSKYGHSAESGEAKHDDFLFLHAYAFEAIFPALFDPEIGTWPMVEQPAV